MEFTTTAIENTDEDKEKTNQRTLREKRWHNQNFNDEERNSVSKFYSINAEPRFRIFEETLRKELDPQKTSLLDYGCGHNVYVNDAAHIIKKGVGIDISETRIELAKSNAEKNNLKNIDFFVMDAAKTTFKNEEFDVIRGSGILHHLDIKLSLNEIKRILKNSGKAFFVEPLDTNPLINLFRKLTPKMRTADEQPLRKKEIKMITYIFPNTEIYYSSFLTLLAVPFRNSKHFEKILSVLSIMDNIVLHNKSPFRWLAWRCLIIMKK